MTVPSDRVVVEWLYGCDDQKATQLDSGCIMVGLLLYSSVVLGNGRQHFE